MMKFKFKYVMLICATLLAGFSSCSNDTDESNSPVNANDHNVTLKVNVGAANSRAVEAGTASGQTPTLTDLTLFFVNNVDDEVTAVLSANVTVITSSAGQTFTAIPGGSNTIYAVGNLSKVASSSVAAIAVASTETQLKAALLDIEGQLAAGTPSYSHVNLYGYATYALPVGVTLATAAMDIYPAVSRLEISAITADPAATPAVNVISAYDLDGIFINNTYKEIGIDNTLYGPALAYPSSDPVWSALSGYPAAFCDNYATPLTGLTSYVPAVGSTWAYYVAPAAKTDTNGDYVGEIIGGVQYDAKPVIVVKLSNITYNPGYTGDTPDPAYITVTKLKNGSVYLDHLERGNVYQIANIEFDATHLTGTGMVPPAHDCEVSVTVKPWTGVTTDPEL